jgi:signal transduction histidine kinase
VSPTVQVVLIAAAASGAVGLVGAAAASWWPRRSVRGVLLAAGLVGVLAVLAGVLGTAQAMFLSAHDFGVVLIVSAVAGPVGLTIALLLSRQVISDVAVLRSAARAVSVDPGGARDARADRGAGEPGSRQPDRRRPVMVELAEVDDELLRTGRRLAQARRHEQALEASRRELIAWVSHDLRTPLAGLRAMAEALEDAIVDDPGRYHRQIRVEVDRLARMVDDLFELSRIQSGALTLSLRTVDVHDLVTDVLDGARPVATSRGVRIGAHVDASTLDADPGGLSRVLANLVINAIRHTPSDGAVEVAATPDREDVVLTVTDRCGGLPAAHLDRVFDTGWRAENARTPQPDGGAGLGLAIARGIVEAHHGRIDVENVEGGCRFVVRLPRLQPAT